MIASTKVGVFLLVFDRLIIFLDEPSTNLDYKSIRDLEKTLKHLKEEGKIILVAKHILSYLSYLLDHLLLYFYTYKII